MLLDPALPRREFFITINQKPPPRSIIPKKPNTFPKSIPSPQPQIPYTTPHPSHSSKNSLKASLTSSAFSSIMKCPESISFTLISSAKGRVDISARAGVPTGSWDAVSRRTGLVRFLAEGGMAGMVVSEYPSSTHKNTLCGWKRREGKFEACAEVGIGGRGLRKE